MKKIIAREGLILLGFLALYIIGISFGSWQFILFAWIGYPVYLAIRFIFWAIRTLRKPL